MSTFTCSQFRSNIVATPHSGVIFAGGHLTISATGTASSVVLLTRIPQGATILDWWMLLQTGAGASQTVQLGTSATPSGLQAILSLSASGLNNAGVDTYRGDGGLLPVRISLSDDVQPRWVWLQAELGAAISASARIKFGVFYTMDGIGGSTTIR